MAGGDGTPGTVGTPGENGTPGRPAPTARGRARRDALVHAASRLLLEDGPAAVTARAVAARAGVPLAGVTYYFADVGEMTRAASARLVDEHLAAARRTVAGVGAGSSDRSVARAVVAAVLGPWVGGRARGVAALYGRALAAAADPRWAPQLRAWDEALPPLLAELLRAAGRDDTRARALLACTDGFAVSAALRGSADVEGELAARVEDVLPVLAPRR